MTPIGQLLSYRRRARHPINVVPDVRNGVFFNSWVYDVVESYEAYPCSLVDTREPLTWATHFPSVVAWIEAIETGPYQRRITVLMLLLWCGDSMDVFPAAGLPVRLSG